MTTIQMKINKFLLLFFLFLTNMIQKIENSQIQMLSDSNSDCIYTLSDGNIVDLSMLRRYHDYTFTIGRYLYKANFCGNMIDTCSGLNVPAAIYIKRNLFFFFQINLYF